MYGPCEMLWSFESALDEHLVDHYRQLCRILPKAPKPEGTTALSWYAYIASFFSGMLLANVVPHFVHGISGDRFPTAFAHPRGKGLSSLTVNVVWALLNLVVGYAPCSASEESRAEATQR
jgi:hypothetical protein